MRQDHRRVLAEMARLEASAAPARRGPRGRLLSTVALREVLRMLERQFATHMKAEDDVIFPALMETLPQARGSILPLSLEHTELRSMLLGLFNLLDAEHGSTRDEQLEVQIRDFSDLLRIHIRKEEAVVFRVAERVLRPEEIEIIAGRLAANETHEAGARSLRPRPKGKRS